MFRLPGINQILICLDNRWMDQRRNIDEKILRFWHDCKISDAFILTDWYMKGLHLQTLLSPNCRNLMELKWIGVMMIWFRLRTEKLSSKTSCQDQSSLCYNRDNVGLISFSLLLSPQYVCPTPASSALWPQGQTAVYLLPAPLRPCQLGQTAED